MWGYRAEHLNISIFRIFVKVQVVGVVKSWAWHWFLEFMFWNTYIVEWLVWQFADISALYKTPATILPLLFISRWAKYGPLICWICRKGIVRKCMKYLHTSASATWITRAWSVFWNILQAWKMATFTGNVEFGANIPRKYSSNWKWTPRLNHRNSTLRIWCTLSWLGSLVLYQRDSILPILLNYLPALPPPYTICHKLHRTSWCRNVFDSVLSSFFHTMMCFP